MRLHEITKDKLNEFAPLAGLAGLARVAGSGIVRGAAGLGLRGALGLGLRGASMLTNFLNSNPEVQNNPEVQVAYDNIQKAETEEEQRQWERALEKQFDQIYPGWRDQEMTSESKSPHPKGSKKYKAHMAAMHAGMNERKLTNKEEGNVEHNVKKLKPHKKNFTDQYGKDGESVMYAVATRDAKKGKSYS